MLCFSFWFLYVIIPFASCIRFLSTKAGSSGAQGDAGVEFLRTTNAFQKDPESTVR